MIQKQHLKVLQSGRFFSVYIMDNCKSRFFNNNNKKKTNEDLDKQSLDKFPNKNAINVEMLGENKYNLHKLQVSEINEERGNDRKKLRTYLKIEKNAENAKNTCDSGDIDENNKRNSNEKTKSNSKKTVPQNPVNIEENTFEKPDTNNPRSVRNFLQQFASSTQETRLSKRAHSPMENENPSGKKLRRFNGLTEKQVADKTLPDHLRENLDIIIIGINPGLASAHAGHHYAGSGNHFWKCLYLSGLTDRQFPPQHGYKLLEKGIGLTNMVERATKGSNNLTKQDLQEGALKLREKLRVFKPKIAVFNGKVIYEAFSGRKDFHYGKQPDLIDEIYVWVMPSSSPRSSLLPRAEDKVPFYLGLKKFRDYLNGVVDSIVESDVVFKIGKKKVK